jgi:branched-chain amino acid transport system permease protein
MTAAYRAASLDAGQDAVAGLRVTRSRQATWWLIILAIAAVAVLGALPYVVFAGTTNELVNVFILMAMASMWNLLAGYAGLVSVGQQAFVGLGAYFVLIFAQHGTSPFLALPLAAIACGVVAVPVWLLVFRLRGGYFAIATWVVASVCYLLIIRFPSLGGGTGVSLPGMSRLNATLLGAYTYWVSLVVVVGVVAAVFLIMRSRFGLVLTAVRDDEIGARSAGARVSSARRLVFLVAAIGCGAAGGLLIISQLNVEPAAAFAVSWSAQMISGLSRARSSAASCSSCCSTCCPVTAPGTGSSSAWWRSQSRSSRRAGSGVRSPI